MNDIPLVVHVVYRLDFGGLETLLVEAINRMPPDRYRHAVVCISSYTEFAKKISAPGVELYALNKKPGLGLSTHFAMWRLLSKLRPAVLHTYNLSAIEYALVAAMVRVPVRVHAEHGRTAADPHGTNAKHNFLRRRMAPLVHRYVPVSADLMAWLHDTVKVSGKKTELINNGVDTEKFSPGDATVTLSHPGWSGPGDFIIGAVGRVEPVKDHEGLIDAFILLRALHPAHAPRMRLVIIGDGPLLERMKQKIRDAGIETSVWLPGARSDIAAVMRSFSVFALSSIAEGTPVTILEAMATGLPVVATRVGGVPEVVDAATGVLVPPSNPNSFANALAGYLLDPKRRQEHGQCGRARILESYSVDAMVSNYLALYDRLRNKEQETPGRMAPCAE